MQVADTSYWHRILTNFLIEAVTKIMSWISRDDEDFSAMVCQECCQAAACCRLADTSFASDKDPLETLLVDYVF